MPGLNTQIMLATARQRFSQFQLRLPTVVRGPAPQLRIAPSHSPSSRQQPTRGTPGTCPPALFLAASDDSRDIEFQRVCSNRMDTYLSRICDAIGQAHNVWRMRAMLVDVVVNAVSASGGRLEGAGLEPDIRLRAPQEDAWQRPRSEAIAYGIGTGWNNWQVSVSVPGLPWYPAFAAFPGPMAPPMPNVPIPLVGLRHLPFHVNAAPLKSYMQARYSGDNEWSNELFEAVAAGFESAFRLWTPTQMIVNVMGRGPVPTFAPPYVPVGPVVGGVGNQSPGSW
jgi:hypothetical protein